MADISARSAPSMISVGRLADGLGLGYGLVWWVLGALLLMPARLGMDVFVFDTTAWQSLMGHLIYGLFLGLVSAALTRRSQHS